MPLRISRLPTETWEECARRYAKKAGVEEKVMKEFYDEVIRGGQDPQYAAYNALANWDALDFVEDNG